MNKFKLPLVDVIEDDHSTTLVFLDEIARETHSVKWNTKSFNPDAQAWMDDPAKMQQVEGWSREILGVELDDIQKAIGKEFTVYSYPTFDSLWEVASKFPQTMRGQIIQGEIDKVEPTPIAIEIWFRYDGDLYVSRMRHDMKVGDQVYTDGTKKNKRYNDFLNKYGCTVEEAANGALKGRVVNVLIKSFGKNTYADIQSIVMAK